MKFKLPIPRYNWLGGFGGWMGGFWVGVFWVGVFWVDGWMDEWTDGRTDGWMDGWKISTIRAMGATIKNK